MQTFSSVDQSGLIVKAVLMAVPRLNSAFLCSQSWWMLDSRSCRLIIRSSGNGSSWHLQMSAVVSHKRIVVFAMCVYEEVTVQ